MSDLNFARTRLESALAAGRTSAGNVIQQVLSTAPVDAIVHARDTALRVEPGLAEQVRGNGRRPGGFTVKRPARPIFSVDGASRPLTDFAFRQLLEKAGVPTAYARDLVDGEPAETWRGPLLETIVNTHTAHSKERYLVRSVGERTHGVLSDRFRRIDCRPMLESFVTACKSVGAEPVSGHSTETRVAVRAVIPTIYEPVPGEAVAFGLHWVNSDFGNGSYSVTAYMLRLVCLNGMVGERALREVHSGGKLTEGVDWSKKTLTATETALALQTGDVVRATLGAGAVEQQLARIRDAHSKEVDFKTAWATVGKSLTKADQTAAQAVFDSADTLNVPPGKTMWRFANALSWVANAEGVSEERKLDLQAVAGKLV